MFLSNVSFYYYKITKVMNCLTGIQERENTVMLSLHQEVANKLTLFGGGV